jgi:hypothetical protein
VAFLKSHGVTFIDAIPPELYPGVDYSAFALDPDGHCIQLTAVRLSKRCLPIIA